MIDMFILLSFIFSDFNISTFRWLFCYFSDLLFKMYQFSCSAVMSNTFLNDIITSLTCDPDSFNLLLTEDFYKLFKMLICFSI